MTNVLIGMAFVVLALVVMIWRAIQDGRVIADGPHRGPAPATRIVGTISVATGDFSGISGGADGGSAGHADGGSCGADGGGGGHC